MSTETTLAEQRARQARLVAALADPGRYPHPVERVERLETHISWVLLAGDFAYKIKKAVDLGFLDFGSLEKRRHFCEDELRLNRRTAPQLYLEVVALTGSETDPALGGAGPAIEYAVKMRRFAQEALLDRMAKRGALEAALVDRLAERIAQFHASVESAPPKSEFGTPAAVAAQALANFDQTEALLGDSPEVGRLERLRHWTERGLARLAPVFAARQAQERVRECHGDLHLGNIALIGGEPTPFDCIEFSAELRWNDVMSELAFLVMDLLDHRLPRLAWRCLNRYLEIAGDYEGVTVLSHYLVYRAMVRAKVACIRREGLADEPRRKIEAEFHGYLELAETLSAPRAPALVLMHGVSGSGKTTVAQDLLETLGAIRVRSDIERKRLHGLAVEARTASALGGGIYGADASRRTYERLGGLARVVLEAGWSAIVDATFLKHAERAAFRTLARELDVPFAIVSCRAPAEQLRERVAAREREARDASEAGVTVLERQLASEEPLDAEELAATVIVEAGRTETAAARLAERLGARP
ncbi:MAG: AAA family ATPase [Betaproteobacteria bacterium]|nr:AAA family ATPase [Betaproteobacteria bacterium]